MTEIDNHDDTQDGEEASRDKSAPIKRPLNAKPGIGGGAVFFLFLLAGLGGAAGGWALSHQFPPKAAMASEPEIDLAPIEKRLARAEKNLEGQKAQLSRLTAEMSSGGATISLGAKAPAAADIEPLLARLARLEALSADSAASESAMEAAPGISTGAVSDRNLEAAITDSSSTMPAPAVDYAPDIEALAARVTALETQIEQTRALAIAPTIIKDTVLLPPFPREAVLAAMTSGNAGAPQSWLDKTLKKHISVRDPEQVARANAALDEIEKNIKAGEHGLALKGVEALPSQARSAAKNWVEAVRREVKG